MAACMKNKLILQLPLKKGEWSVTFNKRSLSSINFTSQLSSASKTNCHALLLPRKHFSTVSRHKWARYNLNQSTLCSVNQGSLCQRSTVHLTAPSKDWSIPSPLSDPLTVLDEFTVEPVLPPTDRLFSPGEEDMRGAVEFFKNHRGSVKPLKGVVDLKRLPVMEYPEVAFLGRSNVGKSSLIKSIFQDPSLRVSVSKTPGHTRILKFFPVAKSFSLVDMPGYGHNMPEYFAESMEEYLKTRRQLTKVFLLIDSKVGILSTDEIAIEMMEELSKPYVIVLTKMDKTTPSRVISHVMDIRRRIRRETNCCFPQPFLTSSSNGWGIAMLQSFITYITGTQIFKSIS